MGRILAGGVAARFNGRLLPVRTFLRRGKFKTQISASSGGGQNKSDENSSGGQAIGNAPGKTISSKCKKDGAVAELSASPGSAAGNSGCVTQLLLCKVSSSSI